METTIQTTSVKINTRPIKDLIKTYVDNQKLYKDQRKSVHNKLERTIDFREAADKAYWNAKELRIFYAAYGLLRGKSFSQTEKNYDANDSNHFLNVRKAKIEKVLDGMRQMSQVK